MNGTPDNDGKLLSYPYKDFPRIAEITLEASEDGQWTAATVANGDGGDFAHYLRDTSGKWQQVTHFEDGVKHVRFGRDHSLYMLSLKDAPRGKVLRLALNTPELSKATIVAPEAKGVVQEFAPADDGLYVSYLQGGPSELVYFPHGSTHPKEISILPSPASPASNAGREMNWSSAMPVIILRLAPVRSRACSLWD